MVFVCGLGKLSQSLSGWDGVFHVGASQRTQVVVLLGRNPFQGGMGFFTKMLGETKVLWITVESQSLSGWDGVFHRLRIVLPRMVKRQAIVAIPFRVGWGFSPGNRSQTLRFRSHCRNPFQGGMGFFTCLVKGGSCGSWIRRNPFQGGMGFFTI